MHDLVVVQEQQALQDLYREAADEAEVDSLAVGGRWGGRTWKLFDFMNW